MRAVQACGHTAQINPSSVPMSGLVRIGYPEPSVSRAEPILVVKTLLFICRTGKMPAYFLIRNCEKQE